MRLSIRFLYVSVQSDDPKYRKYENKTSTLRITMRSVAATVRREIYAIADAVLALISAPTQQLFRPRARLGI